MLAHENPSAVHAGEDQSSPALGTAVLGYAVNQPDPDARSLNDLVLSHRWLRPGDIVYVTETRQHTLTDLDLDAAARAVIGGDA